MQNRRRRLGDKRYKYLLSRAWNLRDKACAHFGRIMVLSCVTTFFEFGWDE